MSLVVTDTISPRHSSVVNIESASITNGTLTSCAYSGGVLSSGTLSGYVIGTSTITSPHISSGTISASVFTAGSIASCSISSPVVTGGTFSGCTLASPVVSAGTFTNFSAEMLLTSGSYTATGLVLSATDTSPADIVGTYRIASLDPFIFLTFNDGLGAYGNGAPVTVSLDFAGNVLPAALRPASTFRGTVRLLHSASATFGVFKVNTDGTVLIYQDAAESAFTATEAITITQPCVFWPIA